MTTILSSLEKEHSRSMLLLWYDQVGHILEIYEAYPVVIWSIAQSSYDLVGCVLGPYEDHPIVMWSIVKSSYSYVVYCKISYSYVVYSIIIFYCVVYCTFRD